MIRRGRFALWGNKEFELVSYQRDYYLQSKNSSDVEIGFSRMKDNEHTFIKQISIEEIEDAYEVIPYVMILGYRFALASCDVETRKVTLVTVNPFVKDKIAVRPYGKFEYIIEIPLGDIKIEEDRVPILGFGGIHF